MKQFIYTFLIAAFLLLANACTEATIFAGGGGDDGKGGAEEGGGSPECKESGFVGGGGIEKHRDGRPGG